MDATEAYIQMAKNALCLLLREVAGSKASVRTLLEEPMTDAALERLIALIQRLAIGSEARRHASQTFLRLLTWCEDYDHAIRAADVLHVGTAMTRQSALCLLEIARSSGFSQHRDLVRRRVFVVDDDLHRGDLFLELAKLSRDHEDDEAVVRDLGQALHMVFRLEQHGQLIDSFLLCADIVAFTQDNADLKRLFRLYEKADLGLLENSEQRKQSQSIMVRICLAYHDREDVDCCVRSMRRASLRQQFEAALRSGPSA